MIYKSCITLKDPNLWELRYTTRRFFGFRVYGFWGLGFRANYGYWDMALGWVGVWGYGVSGVRFGYIGLSGPY